MIRERAIDLVGGFARNASSFRNISRRGEFRNAVKSKASRFTEEKSERGIFTGSRLPTFTRVDTVLGEIPIESGIFNPLSSTNLFSFFFFCIVY